MHVHDLIILMSSFVVNGYSSRKWRCRQVNSKTYMPLEYINDNDRENTCVLGLIRRTGVVWSTAEICLCSSEAKILSDIGKTIICEQEAN